MKKLCCYWEGAKPPAYIAWCVTSWSRYVDLDDVLFLNQSNVSRYLGDVIDVQRLRKFSFAKQSDIVSAAFLYRHGGVFLDSDTVFVNELCRDFIEPPQDSDQLSYFGYESTRAPHIAVLASPAGGTIAGRWLEELFTRVQNPHLDKSWAYVGNDVLDPLVKAPQLANFSKCFDVTKFFATPELSLADIPKATRREKYERFWFQQAMDPTLVQRIIDEAGGIIMLHNSWTPKAIAQASIKTISTAETNFSALLRKVGNTRMIADVQERMYYGS